MSYTDPKSTATGGAGTKAGAGTTGTRSIAEHTLSIPHLNARIFSYLGPLEQSKFAQASHVSNQVYWLALLQQDELYKKVVSHKDLPWHRIEPSLLVRGERHRDILRDL